jgi:hypothetical protein
MGLDIMGLDMVLCGVVARTMPMASSTLWLFLASPRLRVERRPSARERGRLRMRISFTELLFFMVPVESLEEVARLSFGSVEGAVFTNLGF